MGLSKAFSSKAGASIKLGSLPTVPTTEDLLFVLSTATNNKKMAELPFKNPYNNISFIVRVAPATHQHQPRWTFIRCTANGEVALWTRETKEIAMVQGKVRIECNYTGNFEVVPEETGEVAEEGQAPGETDYAESGAEYEYYNTSHTYGQTQESATEAAGQYDEYAAPKGGAYNESYGDDLQVAAEYSTGADDQWHGTQEQGGIPQQNHASGWPQVKEDPASKPSAPSSGAEWEATPEHRDGWQIATGQFAAIQLPEEESLTESNSAPAAKKGKRPSKKQRAKAKEREAAKAREEADKNEADSHQTTEAQAQKEDLMSKAADAEQRATEQRATEQGTAEQRTAEQRTAKSKDTPSEHESSSSDESADDDNWSTMDRYSYAVTVPPPVALYPEVLGNFLASFSDPATGLLTPGAFEFFLLRDMEYVHRRSGKMSLIVFDFVNPKNGVTLNLPTDAVAVVARIMNEACTPLELCTQLRTGEYAILLCGHDGDSALTFAKQLGARLPNGSGLVAVLGDTKALAMGVACIPENCADPGSLISAAIKAKVLARGSHRNYLLFP